MALLEVAGLSVRYAASEADSEASIEIPEGQTLALVGESGSIRVANVAVGELQGTALRKARGY